MKPCYALLLLLFCPTWEVSAQKIYECEPPSSVTCTIRDVVITSPEDMESIELPEGQQFLQIVHGEIPEFHDIIYEQLESTTNLTVTNSGVMKMFVGPKLLHLNASWNKLTQIKHDSDEDYSGLRVLVLSNNEFDRIPNIKNFLGVEVLDLSKNKVDVVNFDLLSRLRRLRRLDLSGNKIVSLDAPNGFKLNELTELRFGSNSLRELDFSNWSLPSLTTLDVSFNLLLYINGADLGDPFPKLSRLELAYNQWNCRGLAELLESLRQRSIAFTPRMAPCPANWTLHREICCMDSYVNYITLQSQWKIRNLQRDMRTMNETLIVKLAAVRDEQGAQIAQLEQKLETQEMQLKHAKERLHTMAGLIEDLIEELYLREKEEEKDEDQLARTVPRVKLVY